MLNLVKITILIEIGLCPFEKETFVDVSMLLTFYIKLFLFIRFIFVCLAEQPGVG